VATGKTRGDVEKEIRGAIEFDLDGLRREGFDIPLPSSSIAMFYNDHSPPHFHARYGEYEMRGWSGG
jgi:predicted RNase H-like HicB family nuclease